MNKLWSTLLAGATGGLVTMGAVKMLDTPQLPQIPETQTYSKQVNYGGAPVPFDFTKGLNGPCPLSCILKQQKARSLLSSGSVRIAIPILSSIFLETVMALNSSHVPVQAQA